MWEETRPYFYQCFPKNASQNILISVRAQQLSTFSIVLEFVILGCGESFVIKMASGRVSSHTPGSQIYSQCVDDDILLKTTLIFNIFFGTYLSGKSEEEIFHMLRVLTQHVPIHSGIRKV